MGVMALLWMRWRRRSVHLRAVRAGRGRDAKVARRLYLQLLKTAARRGVPIHASTTSGRLLHGLREQNEDAERKAAPVVKLYEDVVFGGQALDERRVRDCRDNLNQLKKAS